MTSFTSIQQKINRDSITRNIEEEFISDPVLTSLYFSQLSYFSHDYIHAKLNLLGPNVSSVYQRNGLQAVFVEFDSLVVIAFKGQKNDRWNELKTDLQCWKTTFAGHRVHAGFVKGLSCLSRRLQIDLDEAGPSKHVLFTGHSLGGAFAQLMALEHKPTDVYTFGAPRVFDGTVAEYFKDVNIVRVENTNDLVPLLPPRWMGYKHIGKQVLLSDELTFKKSHRLTSYLMNISKKRFVNEEEQTAICVPDKNEITEGEIPPVSQSL
jgi:hypothetical protein